MLRAFLQIASWVFFAVSSASAAATNAAPRRHADESAHRRVFKLASSIFITTAVSFTFKTGSGFAMVT